MKEMIRELRESPILLGIMLFCIIVIIMGCFYYKYLVENYPDTRNGKNYLVTLYNDSNEVVDSIYARKIGPPKYLFELTDYKGNKISLMGVKYKVKELD